MILSGASLVGLSPANWIGLAGLLLSAWLISYVVYQCYFHPLANFPGPVMFKLTRTWYAIHARNTLWHRNLMSMHAKYGPAVRVAPDEISVADPAAHKQIYSAANSQLFIKAPAYTVVKGHRTFDLASETDPKVHGKQRRLVAKAYSMDFIRKLQPAVDEVIEIFLKKFESLQGHTIDLGYYLQAFSFDVVGAVSFSRIFGFVQSGKDNGEMHRLYKSISSIGWIQHVPWVLKLHNNVIMPIFGNFIAINDRHGHFYDMSNEEVEDWKKRADLQRDMVSQLMDVQKDKPELGEKEIKYMMTTNIFAGSDTTSTSMRGIMLYLLRNPDKLEKLVQELQTKQNMGQLSDPMTFEEAEGCHYLQAVLWEGVRLYPAIGSPLARVVPGSGMHIDGKFVPGGFIVASSPYLINRLPEIWGDDANEFNPERWFTTEKEKLTLMKSYFFTFGGGSRTCIGRNLSWLAMAKLIPTMLLHYDLEFVDSDKVYEEYGFVVFIRNIRARVRKRPETVNLIAMEPKTSKEAEAANEFAYSFTW